ncbi:MAG: YigZ family protein [Ruminococcaceae bacterium]|nr:YigZ family protein [Oscillospiraceae bacterium]
MKDAVYTTLEGRASYTYEEKKSVFIGDASPVSTEEDALAFIASVKAKYPDARHHVYAYLLRENSKNRYSDDHEPQGTAGMPVLDVLRKGGFTDAVIVVTRYFGGTLLGAGGLVRAYTAAASGAVKEAGTRTYRTYRPIALSVSYTDYNKLLPELERRAVRIRDTAYTDEVSLSLSMPEEDYPDFARFVTEATAARAVLIPSDPIFDHE